MNIPTFEEKWESLKQSLMDSQSVICPHCGYKEDSSKEIAEMGDLITYWGEGDRVEVDCPECERIFFVKESVERTYESFLTKEE